jgi:hypothetical protein
LAGLEMGILARHGSRSGRGGPVNNRAKQEDNR